MTTDILNEHVQKIVSDAKKLSISHGGETDAPVNYACIFTHSDTEYDEMVNTALKLGTIAQDTAMGPVIRVNPTISTDAGELKLIKVRRPDPKRPERGDADFTLSNYQTFKKANLDKPGWSLISRPEMEMLELTDPDFDVFAYYSNPTLAEVIELKSAPYLGIIIQESLKNPDILRDLKILKTVVEPVLESHKTPWIEQWTMHTVEVPKNQADEIADKISKSLETEHPWYADFKNDSYHYVIFTDKFFKVDRSKKEQYDEAVKYGSELGIPNHQLDFSPQMREWERI